MHAHLQWELQLESDRWRFCEGLRGLYPRRRRRRSLAVEMTPQDRRPFLWRWSEAVYHQTQPLAYSVHMFICRRQMNESAKYCPWSPWKWALVWPSRMTDSIKSNISGMFSWQKFYFLFVGSTKQSNDRWHQREHQQHKQNSDDNSSKLSTQDGFQEDNAFYSGMMSYFYKYQYYNVTKQFVTTPLQTFT